MFAFLMIMFSFRKGSDGWKFVWESCNTLFKFIDALRPRGFPNSYIASPSFGSYFLMRQ